MSKITVTTKSHQQINAEFREAFKNVLPPNAPKPLTQADRLAPYRTPILKQRQRGLTWKQIADVMCTAPISEKVSAQLLTSVFGGEGNGPAKPKTSKQHLVFDPVTGKEITPAPKPAKAKGAAKPQPKAAPKPAPARAGLSPEQRTFFDWLAPKIIQMACVGNNAEEQLRANAAAQWHNAGPGVVEGFVKAAWDELDALTSEVAVPKYRITASAFDYWRKAWDAMPAAPQR